ncbi:MAG: hypothetical protein IJR51_02345 [Clostridia bacterium]|nr:hypothetical protein [Clostridia bacterium]MBR5424709.1 hypothetical protein [Clostridia bacterium]
MTRSKINRRALGVLILTALVFLFFIIMVYRTQLASRAAGAADTATVKTYSIPVSADRGEILDRSGNTFVFNEQVNSIVLNALSFPSDTAEGNEVLLHLVRFLESRDEEWIDNLPIRRSADGSLAFEENREADIRWMKSSYYLNLNAYATAENCYNALLEEYGLEDYAPEDALRVASVRYNMTRRGFNVTTPYTFATGVSIQTVAYIKENNTFFRGADAEVTSERKYIGNGHLASHLLGLVGAINAEEYEEQKALTDEALQAAADDPEKQAEIKSAAYSLSDKIGKNGIEQAMEPYLKGTNGVKTLTVSGSGKVEEEYSVLPRTGGTAILTLDIPMQQIAEASLARQIREVTDEDAIAGGMSPAGAVVVEDVRTGAILASASYPDFSLSTYYEDYNELAQDAGKPLWNRAFQSGYSPGSTMKPATAVAGLEEEVITPDTYVFCEGTYEYIDQTFVCFNKTAHGFVNVQQALAYSCNIFFFDVAQKVGIQKLNSYASLLGLGQKTGVEISETAGLVAGYEEREAQGLGWRPGETLLAAIGQSDNSFSPLQLTNYCATIANGGTRYVPYLVSKVLSADYSQIYYERNPQVAVQTNIKDTTIQAIKEGMYLVANETSCREQLGHLKYDVACKTGTAEKTRIVDGTIYEGTDGFLIAFGPYEEPEIAITVVIENAGSGASTAQVAADIFTYYFDTLNTVQNVQPENELLG